jgi:hypothetical protein
MRTWILSQLARSLIVARAENYAIRMRACCAHAAVYRAMRSTPTEALAACQDHGYLHEAIHAIFDGPDGTAGARVDAAIEAHIAALGERALRAEAMADELRARLTNARAKSEAA